MTASLSRGRRAGDLAGTNLKLEQDLLAWQSQQVSTLKDQSHARHQRARPQTNLRHFETKPASGASHRHTFLGRDKEGVTEADMIHRIVGTQFSCWKRFSDSRRSLQNYCFKLEYSGPHRNVFSTGKGAGRKAQVLKIGG